MAAITLEGVRKSFGALEVIKGVDLEIADREFVVFVGPSGCGKSTMLRLIAGLEDASDGRILLGRDDVTGLAAAERKLSMVFQSYALYPHMSVADNMGFALKIAGAPKTEIDQKVARAAEILELTPLLDRRPKALSGGQRQRVAIGRAIVRDPLAFLFDEPLSNLDAALRVQTRIEIARLHQKLAATMIYVTHDQVEAMTLADRIVVFSGGRIEQVGPPMALYRNPANLFVAGFIGSPKMNFLDCRPGAEPHRVVLANGAEASVEATVATDAPPTILGIRPEHIEITSSDHGHVRGTIGVAEHLGGDSYYYVDVPELGTVTVRALGESDFDAGDNVDLRFPAGAVHLFDAQERALTRR